MTVKSAERVLKILEALARHQPASMPQLRKELDIPRSSLHSLMAVLVDRGFATVDERNQFCIGLKAFETGATWLETMSLENTARPVLRSLVQELNQIAHLGVLDGTDIMYVMKQENESSVRLVSAVGRRLPAHTTALGKVLLGALSDDDIVERYQGYSFEPLTAASVTSLAALMDRILEARRDGFSIDAGESTTGVTCYAAPIVDRNHKVVAALSVSALDLDEPEFSQEDYVRKVREAAKRVSSLIGGP